MTVDRKEADQIVALVASEHRRVHYGVVQVLPLHRGVVADDDIPVVDIFPAVDFQAVTHSHSDRVGDKHRHAAGRLGQEFAGGADEANGVVFVFVNIGAESRARHVGVDLIADRNDAMADDFQSDRVDFSFDGIVHYNQFAHVGRYYSRQFCDPFN